MDKYKCINNNEMIYPVKFIFSEKDSLKHVEDNMRPQGRRFRTSSLGVVWVIYLFTIYREVSQPWSGAEMCNLLAYN